MRQRRASGSLYFKKLVEEMFIRWLNLSMVSRKYPGTGYDSDESWDLVDLGVEWEACDDGVWAAEKNISPESRYGIMCLKDLMKAIRLRYGHKAIWQ